MTEMTLTDWIQAVSTAILVIITAIYAWRTHVISVSTEKAAEATKAQADASVRMAQEMEAQRRNGAMPILTCQVTGVTNTVQGLGPNHVTGKLANVGLGPALHVIWNLRCGDLPFPPEKWALMEKDVSFSGNFQISEPPFKEHFKGKTSDELSYEFEVSWEDVYGTRFKAVNRIERPDSGLVDGRLELFRNGRPLAAESTEPTP